MPHASPATLAACLAGAHACAATCTDLKDLTTADGPQELAAALAAPLAVAPGPEIQAAAVILVPDPSLIPSLFSSSRQHPKKMAQRTPRARRPES